MPRKVRPIERPSKMRDATLLIIASEDKYAVEVYFKEFRTIRTQIIPLATEDCRSSPSAIIERLDRYKDENAILDGDQFWYCGDTDHWIEPNHIGNLVEVLQHCRTKQYGIALSNPCFELWLLLHYSDVTAASELNCIAPVPLIPRNNSIPTVPLHFFTSVEIAAALAIKASPVAPKSGRVNWKVCRLSSDMPPRRFQFGEELHQIYGEFVSPFSGRTSFSRLQCEKTR